MSDHLRENDSPQRCAQCGATGELLYVEHGFGRSDWLHPDCIDFRFLSDERPTSARLARVWLAWMKARGRL